MRGFLHFNFYLKWLLVLVTIACAANTPGFTQETAFSKRPIIKIPSLEGLKVKCILKDAYGFMWFGTETGLYRYDGYHTELINTASVGIRLAADLVLVLYEDQQANLWIGTGNGLQQLSADRKSIKSFLVTSGAVAAAEKAIYAITQTHDGAIWCSADDGYLYRSANKKSFLRVPGSFATDFTGLQRIVRHIAEDNKQQIWVGDSQHGFRKFDQQGRLLQDYSVLENRESLACFTTKQTQLYADQQNIYAYNPGLQKFIPLWNPAKRSFVNGLVRLIYQDKKGFLWLVTQNELFRLNPKLKQLENFTEQFMHSGASYFQIEYMYEDANNQLWLGSYFGVYRLNNKESIFKTITLPQGVGSNPYFSTRGLLQTADGNLFIGGYSGLFKYNPDLNQFKEYKIKINNSWVNPLARALVGNHDGTMWLATEGFGLIYFNPESQAVTTYLDKPKVPAKSQEPIVSTHNLSLIKDSKGRLWLGGYNNLYTLNSPNAEPQLFNWQPVKKEFPLLQVLTIHQSRNKFIWLGTDYGLYRINSAQNEIVHYASAVPGVTKAKLTHNFINCIYEDKQGLLWLGTKGGGINVLNPATGRVVARYTVKEGLADNKVCAILPGAENQLWISTFNGLSRLHRKSQSFRNFYRRDGLLTNEFNQGSALAGTDGNLYFGSMDGIIYFNPQKVLPPVQEPQVILTKLVQHNGLKKKIEETILSIGSLKQINLHYQDKFFTVYFSIKNIFGQSTTHQQFAYRLVGLNQEWQNIGASNYIQFAGLPAGHYTLSIRAMGSNGIWTKELHIPVGVEQAFYRTLGAYLFYALVAVSILSIIFWVQLSRIRLQNKFALEHLQNEKLLELNQLKTQFFTNITHEFRTPLTLIISPLEQLRAQPVLPGPPIIRQQHEIIYRNAHRLLRLISQLLDSAKLEAGSMKITEKQGNVVVFVEGLVETFRLQAQEKNILLEYHAALKSVNCFFDAEKLENIVYNLLANALKFTAAGGTVRVALALTKIAPAKNLLELRVTDTGLGIPASQLPFVFNRFYQVNDARIKSLAGSGLGLSLVKELTALLGGHVAADSQVDKGTTFTVTLPLRLANKAAPEKPAPLPVKVPAAALPEVSLVPAVKDAPLLLVVEDHQELRNFLGKGLANKYRVIMAADGAEGWQLTQQELPDLIIADVSMPQMDGFTLSQLIKGTPLTTHIPVILLTARTAANDRVQGLTAGANDYLTKPFSLQELQLRVANWLNHQQTLRQYWYQKFVNPNQPEEQETLPEKPVEDPFLQEVYLVLSQELGNPDFAVEQLADKTNVSPRTLHRKLAALTNMNANTLIRTYRLNKAAAFLREGYAVSEVADLTGFEGLSYFSKCFKEQFSVSPSGYALSQNRTI